jgi:signal transduction histidine kinase
LIAAIGHDLRTPITSLRLRCEFVDDPELKERMLASLDELQTLTEAALEAARAEGGGEPRRAVNISALVDSLGADLADLGMAVTTDASEAVTCMCRPGEIRRAVRNLIENAVRYGGEARVSVARDGNDVVVKVEDKGPGIPQDQINGVFEPFSRLETSRNRETGGHGLGLTIARAVARNHGGDITLANRVEGGLAATLRISLGR